MTQFTLFFDSACPLCAKEMARLARWDQHARLAYIDIQEPGFDAARYGSSLAAMDAELHALTADGKMLVGIDAIIAAYTAVGKSWMIWPLKPALTRGFWQRTYRWFARNRYRMSRLMGYPVCANGVCEAKFR